MNILRACIALTMAISSPSHAGMNEMPSRFQKDVQCMVKVLNSTPQVDEVESGALSTEGWVHPFVRYRYRERDGQIGVVQFVADKANSSEGTIEYVALLNGIYDDDKEPPVFGSVDISNRFRLQCGVHSVVVFG
ncbi:MAG TPA: hypothetical protein VGH80_15115 [Xanthomonadaceae bacterium]|jgi:hypothetical protein